jgi:phosphoribosylglycinamide formyltransferase-1
MKKLVILISGSGSNLRSIYHKIEDGEINATISMVISNKPCNGIDFASKNNIPYKVFPHIEYKSRVLYDRGLSIEINNINPDFIILAGFMRVLTPFFVKNYNGRLINIHPSLLPKHKGLNTHQRAIDAKDTEHGSTVHLVNEEVDGGTPIAYIKLKILEDDTKETLEARIKKQENKLYPEVIKLLCNNKITLKKNTVALNGTIKSKPIQLKF